MADKNISALPLAPDLYDDSMLVVEQQGQAMKLCGAQFRAFGRQAVIEEVQDYVDQAQAAAGSIVNMTVEARTLEDGQPASVTKTVKAGKVHLDFGLPRGAQGVPGPDGPAGPRGPKGEPGAGLEIAGRYDAPDQVPDPQEGKSYYIGTQPPYDLYTYLDGAWVNNGPLSGGGGGGGPLPENAVTAEGGGELVMDEALGSAPFQVIFTSEEEPPLTAQDVAYGAGSTVQEALEDLFTSVSDGKKAVASAITDKGVPTAQDAAFDTMAENIRAIQTGTDTSNATATPGDILAPKTAYTAAGRVEGLIPTLPAQTITPGVQNKTIANGQYLGGTQTILGDANLTPANIRQGVRIFGVAGNMTSQFNATLTVKADTGAVVTATRSGGGEVSGLSTNGSVTLELPMEGTWTVTAVRGVTQYNSVVVNVTSRYNAELTAEVHIEFFREIERLSDARFALSAGTVGNYAVFCGGMGSYIGLDSYPASHDTVDVYDKELTRRDGAALTVARSYLAGASNGSKLLFGGGWRWTSNQKSAFYSQVDVYDASLTHTTAAELSIARGYLAAAAINGNILFVGGTDTTSISDLGKSVVDAYDTNLTRTSPTVSAGTGRHAGASNDAYAVFSDNANGVVTAYDASLTRKIAAKLGQAGVDSAVRAGNYVVFVNGENIYAYDLFLTRVIPEKPTNNAPGRVSTTLKSFGLFLGGIKHIDNKVTMGNTEIYDPYLTHTFIQNDALKGTGYKDATGAAASVGDFAIAGGGSSSPWATGRAAALYDTYAYQYV